MKQAEPQINKHKYLSPVWILPIIAALLGAWLMLQSVGNKGIEVSIHFNEATGIKPGKTKVRYKGLEVGEVVQLTLDDSLEGVNVQVRIKPQAASILRSGSHFWLVSPKASLTGISGLDTLVSGNYIDVLPGEGSASTQFEALASAPAIQSGNGLSIRLTSDKLGSLSVGAPVYFKQVKVGEVHDYKLSKNNKVLISLIIDKKFAYLVKQNSRFWNISGFQAELSGNGLKVHLNGLASLIAGGIAFDSPDDTQLATANQDYILYPDLRASQRGIEVSLSLPQNHGVKRHSKLMLNELEIGEVTQIYLDKNAQAQATLLISPMAKSYLNTNSSLYLLKPEIGLGGIKNVANLLTGNHLGLFIGEGDPNAKPQTHFQVLNEPPLAFKGTVLDLSSQHVKNIKVGSPVLYLGYEVGQVISTQINKQQSGISVKVLIKQEHQALLSKHCRFYIDSPISVNANLEGLTVEAGGLDSFISGQITLIKPKHLHRHLNVLYPSKQAALLSKKQAGKKRQITLSPVGEIKSVANGANLIYKGLVIGQVKQKKLQHEQLQYLVALDPQYQHLVSHRSIFWYQKPFALDASMSQVKLEMAPFSALIKGGIEMALVEKTTTKQSKPDFYSLFSNFDEASSAKVPITLLFKDVRALSQGTLIRYRGLTVGKIEQFWLSFDAKQVQAKAYLYKKYASLFTHKQSQFWLVEPKVALTEVANLDTLIKGAFIQAEPGNKERHAETQFSFKVAEQAPLVSTPGLVIKLASRQKASINVGSPLFFRQLQVGLITKSELSPNSDKIWFEADILPQYAHLIRSNSQFWNVSGLNIDIGITGGEIQAESLETIMTGGIAFSSPNGQGEAVKAGHQFTLYAQAKKEWLKWDPEIKNE